MNPLRTLVLISSFVFSACIFAQSVVSKDGREIILNDDGTWEYAPEGILVETEDGRKARLKPDNTWQYLESTELQEQVVSGSNGGSSSNSRVRLKETFITSSGPKQTTIVKNKRSSSSMTFVLEVTQGKNSQFSSQIKSLKPSSFRVTDDKNEKYDVAEIASNAEKLAAGRTTLLEVITTSAPGKLFGPDEVYLTIPAGTLGLNKTAKFSVSVRDIETQSE